MSRSCESGILAECVEIELTLHKAIEEFQATSRELEKARWRKVYLNILKLVLIGFFIGRDIDSRISELAKKRERMEESIKRQMSKELDLARNCVRKIQKSGTYLVHTDKERYISSLELLEKDLSSLGENGICEQQFIDAAKDELRASHQAISDYNAEFVERRRRDYSYLWNKGLLALDEEQQVAIVTDDMHNLVVAAAGSGKTEVLITRIAYLIARKPDGAEPRRILAIAYTRKAKEEIEQRLLDRYDISDVNVRTFHKLGKDILERAWGRIRRTDIVDENKKFDVMKRIFEHKIESQPDFYELFVRFAKTLHDKEEGGSGAEEETLEYARERPYFSIDNTHVSSQAEKEIMDFFLTHRLNGKPLKVVYEPDVGGFRPDFYLPQYDLFIEHWALNEEGEVPEWFSQSTKEYRKAMEEKKRWFAENDKLLVETFTYEYDPDNPEQFVQLLKNRVTQKLQTRHNTSFDFTLKAYDEIVEIAWGPYKNPANEIVSFVTIAKTYGLTPSRINEKLRTMRWTRKQLAFGHLAVEVYYAYEDELREHGKIDFEDMINKAINELAKDPRLYADIFDHILVDEYQDISAQRYNLIKTLLDRNPNCKLFCVGDDWQSIMAFSGSNLEFFVNFQKYFENPAVTKISTNYRSVRSIVEAGAYLIENNRSCQIQKPTLAIRNEMKPIRVITSPHRREYQNNYYRDTVEDCLRRIAEYLQRGFAAGEILVLSRYMRTKVARGYRFLSLIRVFLEMAKENGIKIACDNAEARNRIRLLTVHKSKGLEAKVVFVLNVIKDLYGFPSEIEDPSIFEPARENYPPQDQEEEERRLFYVAMTRAMEDLYIYTWKPAKSEFLEEIEDHVEEVRLSY